jgi:mannosidase alpha-like ER degradation enhancer 2
MHLRWTMPWIAVDGFTCLLEYWLLLLQGELKPLTCQGGNFEPIKIPLVTLIDTLDTLVVLGDFVEFRNAVSKVSTHYRSFDLDVNVSVFETTIRILGGLLSAHLMAIDRNLGIYVRHVPSISYAMICDSRAFNF